MIEHNPRTWLSYWAPEDPGFWESTGKSLAWKTLIITTLNLMMAFIVWFVVSALVVRLPNVGFKLNATEAVLADGDARFGRWSAAHPAHLFDTDVWYPPRCYILDPVLADTSAGLVLRRAGSFDALLGIADVVFSGRTRWRKFLLVHALD